MIIHSSQIQSCFKKCSESSLGHKVPFTLQQHEKNTKQKNIFFAKYPNPVVQQENAR